jgi:hypothetical protein
MKDLKQLGFVGQAWTVEPDENTVRYTLTRSDLLAFQTRALLRNKGLIVVSCLCFLLVVILNVKHPADYHASKAFNLGVAVATAFVLSLVMVIIAYVFLVISVWTGKHQNVLLEQTVTLTPIGFEARSANGEGFLKWSAVYEFVSTRKLLIIFFNQTTARIIPKRCFPTPEAAAAFEQNIRSRLQQA